MTSQNDALTTIREASTTPAVQEALEELERLAKTWIERQRRKTELRMQKRLRGCLPPA